MLEELTSLAFAPISKAQGDPGRHRYCLGSVWVGAFDDAAVKQALKAQTDWRPVALLPIGHPAEPPPATPRRALSVTAREAGTVSAG